MILLRLITAIPLIFAAFAVQVNWSSGAQDGINIRAEAQSEFIKQCLQSGLALRFSYHQQFCYRRSFWFDGCRKERVEVREVVYDPIAEQYRYSTDMLGDGDRPVQNSVPSAQEALELLSAVKGVKLHLLEGFEEAAKIRSGAYLGVRVVAECRGASPGFFGQIPLILSFGMIDNSTFDSGWVGFDLASSSTSQAVPGK